MSTDVTNNVGHTRDCKIAGCTEPATAAVGMYALLCTKHADEKRRTSQPRQQAAPTTGGGFVADLNRLLQLAKDADKARTKAEALTRQALAAKKEAETAASYYQQALRDAIGDGA